MFKNKSKSAEGEKRDTSKNTKSLGKKFLKPDRSSGKRSSSEESQLIRLTGLFENKSGKSWGGATNEDIEVTTDAGNVHIPADSRFVVVENQFQRDESDPPYVLFVSTAAYERR